MEERNEIMVNDCGDALEPVENEEEAEKERSAWPVIAGIGAIGMLMGIAAHKYVISPGGAKFKAWRQAKKADKGSGKAVVEAEIVDSSEDK